MTPMMSPALLLLMCGVLSLGDHGDNKTVPDEVRRRVLKSWVDYYEDDTWYEEQDVADWISSLNNHELGSLLEALEFDDLAQSANLAANDIDYDDFNDFNDFDYFDYDNVDYDDYDYGDFDMLEAGSGDIDVSSGTEDCNEAFFKAIAQNPTVTCLGDTVKNPILYKCKLSSTSKLPINQHCPKETKPDAISNAVRAAELSFYSQSENTCAYRRDACHGRDLAAEMVKIQDCVEKISTYVNGFKGKNSLWRARCDNLAQNTCKKGDIEFSFWAFKPGAQDNVDWINPTESGCAYMDGKRNGGGSSNQPVFVTIQKKQGGKESLTRASLKKQKVGPALDYFGMKVAEWLTYIFRRKQNAPLFQTYQIVPQFEPRTPSMTENQKVKFRKCLKDRVSESFFFSIFEAGSKNWIDAPKPGDNWKCKATPYFDALQCGCQKDKLLRSIKGALILQTMTGARDRHDGNLQIRNCKLINMDYGHSLGNTAFADNGVFNTQDHYVTVYSEYLQMYLKKSNLLSDEMTKFVGKIEKDGRSKDPIVNDIKKSLKRIKKHMTRHEKSTFKKLFTSKNYGTWQEMVPLRSWHPLKPLDYMHYLLFGDEPVKPNAKIRLDLDDTDKQSFVYKMLHDNSDTKIKNHIKNHVIGRSPQCGLGDDAQPPEAFYTSTLYGSEPKYTLADISNCPN